MKKPTLKQEDKQTRASDGGSGSFWLHQGEQEERGRMCLNQSVLSCSGTHFIRLSSWGRGSMRPHIYHTNPSGLSPSFTDSMRVIGARPSDQKTHCLPALIHSYLHLTLSLIRFLICAPLSVFLWCSPISSTFVLHFSLSTFSSFFVGCGGDRCWTALNGF